MVQDKIVSYNKQSRTLTGWSGKWLYQFINGLDQDHIMGEPAQHIYSTFQEWSRTLTSWFMGIHKYPRPRSYHGRTCPGLSQHISRMVQNKIVSHEKQSRTLTGWPGKWLWVFLNSTDQDHIIGEPAQHIHSTFQEWSGSCSQGHIWSRTK